MQPLPYKVGRSVPVFSQEDKFETCLNLAPYITAQVLCSTLATWEEYKTHPDRTHWISVEMAYEFQQLGYSPAQVSNFTLNPLLPAKIAKKILSTRVMIPSVKEHEYRKLNRQADFMTKQNLGIQLKHITSCCLGELKKVIGRNHEIWDKKLEEFPVQVRNALAASEDCQVLLNQVKELRSYIHGSSAEERAAKRHKGGRGDLYLGSIGVHVQVLKDFVLYHEGGETWLIPHLYCLEICNKVSEMASLLLYNHCVDGTSMPTGHFDVSIKFLTHCANVLLKQRPLVKNPEIRTARALTANLGFTFLKTMEALGVGTMINREDKEQFGEDNVMLLETMWSALWEEKIVDEEFYENSETYEILSGLETPQVSDLIGTVKVLGHPTIDIIGGLEKLNARVHKKLELDDVTIYHGVGVMQRDVVINFYRQHKRYPLMDVPDSIPLLKQMVQKNISPLEGSGADTVRGISSIQWYQISFKKNADFDKADRQFDLIKDKALGVTRSNVIKQFLLPINKRARSDPVQRRALLRFLLTPFFTQDFADYLSEYMKGDTFSDYILEYLVIKLTAKELELKALGRYFGASPMEERLRRQVQEMNTANFMRQYVPEQLLTPGELDAIHKLVAFKRLTPSYPNHTLIHVSADFSSWNNNFRRETVDKSAGVVLDSWFGLDKLYQKTMLAFENMFVYYDDSNYRVYWDGQLGGIEGKSSIVN